MNDDEKTLAFALAQCVFVPGVATKRFARNMAFQANDHPAKELTPKQRKYLCEAVVKFRRQIPASAVSLARTMLAATQVEATASSETVR